MPQPMYQQIADTIRQQIEDGELPRGKQLPTELELRETFDASRNTVRDAIKRLAALGLVETKPGQGTFVTRAKDPFVTTLSTDPKTGFGGGEGASRLSALAVAGGTEKETVASTPRVEVQKAEAWMQRRLRLPADNPQVVVRRQQRHIGDIAWSLQTSYYPMSFITRGAIKLLTAEDIQPGTVAYLTETIGIRQAGYRDWIAARRPDEEEQKFFGITQDSTVFEVFRTAFDQDKESIRVTVSVFPADHNQFIYDIGDDLPEPQFDDRPPAAS
ncbi:MAG TPA: GntR family transcriptional regulator [Trebonia sp.]|jgi:GntR family transcriptional regulator